MTKTIKEDNIMGMRIANNISAMNTHRWLSAADAGLTKSLERLSSGYRINRAADDAAGLTISQSFRADIASFRVASRNTTEASSMLQVAEGGMDQIGNMLTRLKELATQAASANVGDAERVKIDAEADELVAEIDRIANATKYGSTSLLDGTFGASQAGALGAGSAGNGVVDDDYDNVVYKFTFTGAGSAKVTALGSNVAEGLYTITQTAANQFKIANTAGTVSETYTGSLTGTSVSFTNLGITITVTAGSINETFSVASTTKLEFERTGLTSLNVENAATGTYTITETTAGQIKIANSSGTASQTVSFQAHGETLNFDVLGISFTLGTDYSNTTGELDGMKLTVSANTDASGNTFQIGAENDTNNQISISIDAVKTTTLGINTIDLSTATKAQTALDSIDTAISTLAGSRGDIGAAMNRLSYASANLATTIENVQAAESVIRDVDMASEMTTFTKNQILLQAGTAMLAQANMAPQQVLALFR
jgi:flagellin